MVQARGGRAALDALDTFRVPAVHREGPFGVMVVGDAAGGVVAARGRRGTDPARLWERLSVAIDGVRGRRAS